MTPQRLREYHRHFDRIRYVEKSTGILSEEVAPGEPFFCDFCSADEPTEAFKTKPFTVGLIGPALNWSSDENWAACGTCANLVRTSDKYNLRKRCLHELARRYDTPQSNIRFQLDTMLALFWENFLGEG